jgi:hypothetical protein
MRYSTGYAVTPSDSVDIRANDRSDALYVGTVGTGTLSVLMEDGKQLDLVGITVGYHPLAVKRVRVTGTGVSNILALKF